MGLRTNFRAMGPGTQPPATPCEPRAPPQSRSGRRSSDLQGTGVPAHPRAEKNRCHRCSSCCEGQDRGDPTVLLPSITKSSLCLLHGGASSATTPLPSPLPPGYQEAAPHPGTQRIPTPSYPRCTELWRGKKNPKRTENQQNQTIPAKSLSDTHQLPWGGIRGSRRPSTTTPNRGPSRPVHAPAWLSSSL